MQPPVDWDEQPDLWVRSGAAELAVSVLGADGVPLLALHPGVADRRVWRWCAPAWRAAGLRVVTYDRRGYGQTRYRPERHDDLADLRAVTEATGSRPAVVVGNSAGGALAVDLALARPDEVAALVLVAATPSGFPEQDYREVEAEAALDRQIEEAEQAGDLDLVNRLEVRYWLDGVAQPEGRVANPARQLMLEMNGRALAAAPPGEQPARAPAWPQLDRIPDRVRVRTLVVLGEHDLPGVNDMGAQLAGRLPGSRLVVLDGSAHLPSLDQPERLAELVVELVRSLR